ncbi:MAG TPA: SGNH/GDSL hydrolase family protein [Actinomycetota bacterium]|nr:SGNH/GDSL hydrolase family protein [Actinomycetota bacterium]
MRRPVVCALLLLAAACVGVERPEPTPDARPTAWTYVALGDSLADAGERGYVPAFAGMLEESLGTDVRLLNLGVSGWTTRDLLGALRSDDQLRDALRSADVVTFNIGGNDLLRARAIFGTARCGGTACLAEAVAGFRTNWDEILDEILLLRDPRDVMVRTLDIYNPYAAQQVRDGTFDTLAPFLEEANERIRTSAEVRGLRWARVHEAFNGPGGRSDPVAQGLIADDGLHPSDTGHRLIAERLMALGTRPLVAPR